MSKRKVAIWAYTCERCEHQWIQREQGTPEPKVCPNRACKSPYWNKPRQRPAATRGERKKPRAWHNGEHMMAPTRTPSCRGLRLADLKLRQPGATRLLSAKVPAAIAKRIAEIATRVDASKTDVLVALINTGLDRLNRRTRKQA